MIEYAYWPDPVDRGVLYISFSETLSCIIDEGHLIEGIERMEVEGYTATIHIAAAFKMANVFNSFIEYAKECFASFSREEDIEFVKVEPFRDE